MSIIKVLCRVYLFIYFGNFFENIESYHFYDLIKFC